MMRLYFHNTFGDKKEEFIPLDNKEVKMYHCGPTLYDRQHIGNLSMFVFTDILRRTLEYAGFKVKQVINFTDFGHLTGDNEGDPDIGEDKMTKGLRREGLELNLPNMKILAKKYADIFLSNLKDLNIKIEGTIFPYASDYIKEQIELIEKIEKNSYTYVGEKAVYFDTKKFINYGKLGSIDFENLEEGKRVHIEDEKRNSTDFVLWKKDPKIGWQSPWGIGFPGWHIECSAMIIKILGEQIDIHTGGIEHINIHHNNEIAESESATGKTPFAKFWLHRNHLKMNGVKIAKSSGGLIFLDELQKRGISPISLRYFLLTSHYKTPTNFTIEAVEGAQIALEKLVFQYENLPQEDTSDKEIIEKFESAISDDLNTAVPLSLIQNAKSRFVIDTIDKILGLNIKELSKEANNIPEDITKKVLERNKMREEKKWQESDKLREEITNLGFFIEDTETKTIIKKRPLVI